MKNQKLNLSYFTPQSVRGYQFITIPTLLITHEAFDPIDLGAKMLYGMMLNRASLSVINADNFTDATGRLYIIYTVEQVMKDLRCGNKYAVKIIKQLEEIGLIEKKRQGQGKPSLIFVKDFSGVDFTGHFQKCTKDISENVRKTFQEVANGHSSKTDFSQSDFNQSINQSIDQKPKTKNQVQNQKEIDRLIEQKPNQLADENKKETRAAIAARAIEEYEEYEELVKANIQYDYLIEHSGHQADIVEEITELMIETICSRKEMIRVGGEEKPHAVVASRLKKLDVAHIQYVLECLQSNTSKVHNIRAYLLTTLYNAFTSVTNYYRQQVNYDMKEDIMDRGAAGAFA